MKRYQSFKCSVKIAMTHSNVEIFDLRILIAPFQFLDTAHKCEEGKSRDPPRGWRHPWRGSRRGRTWQWWPEPSPDARNRRVRSSMRCTSTCSHHPSILNAGDEKHWEGNSFFSFLSEEKSKITNNPTLQQLTLLLNQWWHRYCVKTLKIVSSVTVNSK